MSEKIRALANRKCQPCEGEGSPLGLSETKQYLKEVPLWRLAKDRKSIFREFVMKNFVSAVEFIERIAKVAEEEGHHPDLHLTSYKKLNIVLATHAIGGLSPNDFILAAKIDRLPKALKKSA